MLSNLQISDHGLEACAHFQKGWHLFFCVMATMKTGQLGQEGQSSRPIIVNCMSHQEIFGKVDIIFTKKTFHSGLNCVTTLKCITCMILSEKLAEFQIHSQPTSTVSFVCFSFIISQKNQSCCNYWTSGLLSYNTHTWGTWIAEHSVTVICIYSFILWILLVKSLKYVNLTSAGQTCVWWWSCWVRTWEAGSSVTGSQDWCSRQSNKYWLR